MAFKRKKMRAKLPRRFSKKLFKKTSRPKRKGNVGRPHMRGGWRM